MEPIEIGGEYEHYKGNRYRVIGVGLHSETHEKMVVYQGLYNSAEFGDQPIWIRPYEMFFEEVIVNGIRRPRFTLVGNKG